MLASRRNFLMGAAALSAAVVTPETVRAMAAMQLAADWSMATADLEGDVARRAMRRVHGRAPAALEGALFRNGPGKFRRPGRRYAQAPLGERDRRGGHARLRHGRRQPRPPRFER
jgi:all-trans-8'-apo-beta-carotenal 15,15'-oxygenase